MAILKSDIKLMKSQRMEDTADGGGRITGNEISDGAHNSMFPDISDLDRAYGVVHMRKTFLHVKSPDTDKYLGANVAMLTPPDDPSVSVTLMSTDDHYDERSDARDFVERYLARSTQWQGAIYGNQLEGQRSIRFYQREEIRTPEIGEVLVLTQDEGEPTEVEQYVKTVRVEAEMRTFINPQTGKEFEREVVTCEISEPLRYTFEGEEVSEYDQVNTRSKIRETLVANAAKYYGIVPLKQDASFADLTVRGEGIFSQLVPSSRVETPAVDLNAAGDVATLVPTSTGAISFTTALSIAPNRSLYVGTAITPGTLSITIDSATLTDDNGDIKLGDTAVGTINYHEGRFDFGAACPDYGSATKTIAYNVASSSPVITSSELQEISAENRGYAYTRTFTPIPEPGALVVSYMVEGKWYELRDQGNGELRGYDTSIGTGQLDYTTGSLLLTLGALPDVDTWIIFQYGAEVNKADLLAQADEILYHVAELDAEKPVDRDSVVITWDEIDPADGVSTIVRTIKSDPAEIANNDGEIKVEGNKVYFLPDTMGEPGQRSYDITYDLSRTAGTSDRNANVIDQGSTVAYQTGIPLKQGNVKGSLQVVNPDYDGDTDMPTYPTEHAYVPFSDTYRYRQGNRYVWLEPNGNLYKVNGYGYRMQEDPIGTVDYATGELILDKTHSAHFTRQEWNFGRMTKRYGEYKSADVNVGAAAHYFHYSQDGDVDPETMTVTPSALVFGVDLQQNQAMITESVVIDFTDDRYVGRGNDLYRSIDHATGAGTLAGTIDSANGTFTISDWDGGEPSSSFEVKAVMATIDMKHYDSSVAFRTPGAPIAPQSLYLQCYDIHGFKRDITADADGVIDDSFFTGWIDYQTGVVFVNTTRPIDLTTLRFNCVVYNYLPLDAELIGLDPVRLPSDGRVPIFRKGDIAVIHQTETDDRTNVAANTILNTGKVRCAEIYLRETDGSLVDPDQYIADLDAGTVTMGLGFSTRDVELVWRWEDMSLITDVDVSGQMRLGKPLSHDFDADKAWISSACIAGDTWSRYYDLFDQQTWTGEWADHVIGNDVSAQFNDADYPLTTANDGAITERWAIIFTSNNNFKLIGEHVGQIALGTVNEDFAPVNPNSGKPYFTLPWQGWGSGWSAGNVLRFNTNGAIFPFWCIRTVLQNDATIENDEFALQLRGNVDKDA